MSQLLAAEPLSSMAIMPWSFGRGVLPASDKWAATTAKVSTAG